MMAKKPGFIGYVRVSTEKQGRSGLGLEAQQEAVRNFIAMRGGELVTEFKEVESGKNDKRPELEKAIKRCRKTGATLVVAKLDRLSRNVAFLLTLKESGIQLAAADMPESNTLTFTVMAGVAQYEREMISKRTRDALAAAKARGTVLGGFRENAPDISQYQDQGVAAVKYKAQERADGLREDIEPLVREGLSLRAIAAQLNDARIETPQSRKLKAAGRPAKAWSAQGVANVINRLGIDRAA